MNAALFRRGPRIWRSRQLTLALSFPPTNHFAYGGCHSRTRAQGVLHSSSRANEDQKASGSAAARAYTPGRLAVAPGRHASAGGKRRSSWRSAEISSIYLFDAGGKRRETGADIGGERSLFGARVLDELPVVIDRTRDVACRLELARQVVVGRGVVRIDLERAAQAALRVAGLTRRIPREREVHHCVRVAALDAQRGGRFRRRRVKLAEGQGGSRQVYVGSDVLRIDRNEPLDFARRLVEQSLAEIEVPQVVMGLDIHLVALQRRPVVHERLLEIAGAVVVEAERSEERRVGKECRSRWSPY